VRRYRLRHSWLVFLMIDKNPVYWTSLDNA
jgi:hypothetical protein